MDVRWCTCIQVQLNTVVVVLDVRVCGALKMVTRYDGIDKTRMKRIRARSRIAPGTDASKVSSREQLELGSSMCIGQCQLLRLISIRQF
jgi:hypothetical protein